MSAKLHTLGILIEANTNGKYRIDRLPEGREDNFYEQIYALGAADVQRLGENSFYADFNFPIKHDPEWYRTECQGIYDNLCVEIATITQRRTL